MDKAEETRNPHFYPYSWGSSKTGQKVGEGKQPRSRGKNFFRKHGTGRLGHPVCPSVWPLVPSIPNKFLTPWAQNRDEGTLFWACL